MIIMIQRGKNQIETGKLSQVFGSNNFRSNEMSSIDCFIKVKL